MISEIMNNPEKFRSIIFLSVILVTFIVAFILYNLNKKLIASSTLVKAKIISIATTHDNHSRAKISFKDNFGNEVITSIVIHFYHMLKKNYRVNDEIEVFSEVENPQKVKANSFFDLWSVTSALFLSAVILCIMFRYLMYVKILQWPF